MSRRLFPATITIRTAPTPEIPSGLFKQAYYMDYALGDLVTDIDGQDWKRVITGWAIDTEDMAPLTDAPPDKAGCKTGGRRLISVGDVLSFPPDTALWAVMKIDTRGFLVTPIAAPECSLSADRD